MLRTIFKRRNNLITISATADTFEIEYEPEIVLPPSSGQPKPPGALQTTYEMWYLGSKQVAEAKTISTLIYTIKQMKKKPKERSQVKFSFSQGTLNIVSLTGDKESILSLPFYAVALCVLDPARGESGCIAISSTVKMIHQVHVFQGITHDQAQEVVLGLGLAFSETGKVQNQVFAKNPSLFQWENYQMSSSRVGYNYKPSIINTPQARNSSHLTPMSSWDPQKIPAYNDGKAMRPKLKQERELESEQNQFFAPVPATPQLHASQTQQETTHKDKFQRLEEMVSATQESNKQLITSYRGDGAAGSGFFPQAVRSVFSGNTQRLTELLRRNNISINSRDPTGNSLIHFATLQSDPKMILFLVKQSADINQGGTYGVTPLHRAAASHSSQMIKCLLRHNADINATDDHGRSPIFMLYVSTAPKGELATHLVENGAVITREDQYGLKPADLWVDLQSFQQSLVTSLCNCFMQSVPVGYNPGDLLESSSASVSGSLHTTSIPTRHVSVLSLQHSEVDTILMFHNEPLTEEERIAKLEKLRLSSSQFSLVSEDPIAVEAKKLLENTAAMVKVGDKMVHHLEREHPMKPLDLSDIDQVLRQVGVSEDLSMSPTFYLQLKRLQEEVKRKDWERRKYGHSLKRSQTRAYKEEDRRSEWGMKGLEGIGPRELYLPDGTKLDQLKKSASETMLHLINATKEVTPREGQTMDDGMLYTHKSTQIKPGFVRAMRRLRKPIFSFFTGDAAALPKAEPKTRRNNQSRQEPQPEVRSPKLRKRPSYAPKPVDIEEDLNSMHVHSLSLSSVPETGSENSEIFNKLVSKLDPEGDRMGKITQLPLMEHPSVSDMFKMESFSKAKTSLEPFSPARKNLPGGWVTSREEGAAKSHFQIDPDTGKARFVFSEETRQRSDSEPTKQPFGPTVQAPTREGRREEALKRRAGNYSDSTTSYRGNKITTRPGHLPLGMRHESRSNISGGASTIIAHPMGLEETCSEPGAAFIHKLLKLSANSECLGYLLAHMGLSKFFKRFLLYARASGVSEEMRSNMGILVNNLFEVMHHESQRKSIEAGMLELVVQLVDSFWPLPGVALSILTSVIESEWHHDYLTTVAKSPIAPLLRCLNSGIMDSDSGIESGRKSAGKPPLPRGYKESMDTSSGSVIWSESSPLRRQTQPGHLPPSRSSKDSAYDTEKRGLDFKKKFEETSEPLRSVLCPITDPKTVILHILAYASHNDAMKSQLMSGHSLRPINECLYDSNEEHTLLALSTIANVALKTSSHRVLAEATLLRKLRSFLKQESLVAHEAARTLIYMGEFDVEDVYLFDKSEATDSIQYASTEDGTPFVKGGTLEALVEVLTNLPRSLWGGIQLMSPGPKSNNSVHLSLTKFRSKAVKVDPTEEKIFEFFLTTCRSFCEPLILFRLLIHRFRDRLSYSIFDWNLVDLPASRLVYHTLPPTATIPKTQRLVLRVVQSWLRNFPEDFKKFDYMTEEVKHLLLYPLKKVRGPYYDYGQTIKNLLSQIHIKQRFKEPDPIVFRKPHHHHIYCVCNKYIVEGMLPITLEDAVLLSALQIYIETVAEKKQKRVSAFSQDSSKWKSIIPPEYLKVKHIGKRVRDKQAEYTRQQLNERDSKHLYIEYCHALPGFGCQFFAIKEIILKRKYSPVQSRLMGISSTKIVVLDIQTKDSLIEFPFSTLKSWFPNTNDKTIVLTFKKRRYLFFVQDASVVTEISNVLQQSADELNNSPTVEKNPLYTSSEQSPRDKKLSTLIVHEESPINRMAVDNAPTKARKRSKLPHYLTTEEIESNSSSIASASILPSAEESSDNNSTSYDELMALATGVPPTTLSFLHNSEGTHIATKLHQVSSQNGKSHRKSRVPSGNGSADPSPSGLKRISHKLSPRRKFRDRNNRPSPKDSVDKKNKYRDKEGDLTIERDIIHWLSQTRTFDPLEQQTAAKNEFEVFGGVGMGRQVFCNCPPDPEFSPNLRLDHICLEDLLQSPRELARQITLLDFDLLCRITPEDCLNYIIPEQRRGAREGFNEKDAIKLFVDRGNLGKFAYRFGQLSSWVASSVLLFEVLQDRTEALRLFIQAAMECYHLKNYHAVQAIVIGALQSPPIKHLEKTWEGIAPQYRDFIDEISELFEAKNNYAKYRQCIQTTEVPAVPFFLLYLKDLTYIVNANPDYLRGGMINFDKRRLIYARLEEIQYFQSHKYQLKRVPEIRKYLFNARFIAQEKLVHVAHELESRDGRSGGSQGSLYSEGSSNRDVASFYGTISRNITRRGGFVKK